MTLALADVQQGGAANRLVLRDGSVATVRPATPADREAVRRFYHDQSPESRRRHSTFPVAASIAQVSPRTVLM